MSRFFTGSAPTSVLLKTLSAAVCALILLLSIAPSSHPLDLPSGWARVPSAEGRQLSAVHKEAHARMEAWRTQIAEGDAEVFRTTLEAQLSRVGFEQTSSEDVKIAGLPAEMRSYATTILDKEFLLIVLEVTRTGEFWQFTALFRPAETLNREKQISDIKAFATAVLSE